MGIDLSKRTWPKHDPQVWGKPEAGEITGSANKSFVSEGSLFVKAVNFNGLTREIPRESSAITALGLGDNLIYGATSGEEAWLFQYALASYCEAAIPLGPIADCTDVRAIIVRSGHDVYGAGHADGEGHIFHILGLRLPGDVIQEWGLPRPRYERVAVPVPGERIACLQMSRTDGRVYGISEPGGVLFACDLDTGAVETIGAIDPVQFYSPTLVQDEAGVWYVFGALGKVLSYDPSARRLESTGIRVPCFPGRGPYARISAAVAAPNGRLYLGDTEGLLSVVLLDEQRVLSLGKPVPLGGIDQLVRLRNGRIYGLAGSKEGMAHLFVHDPAEPGLRDLGVCCATTEKGWYGYRFGAMVATPEGRIIMGESDHLGCLFNYFPPV